MRFLSILFHVRLLRLILSVRLSTLVQQRLVFNMTAVRDMGRIIKEASQEDPMGPGKLVVFANAVEDNPFMAGAFHGVGGG